MPPFRDEEFANRIVMTPEQYSSLYRKRIRINTQINNLLFSIFEARFIEYHNDKLFKFIDNSGTYRHIIRRYTLQTQATENYLGYILHRSYINDYISMKSEAWENFNETVAVWDNLKASLAESRQNLKFYNDMRMIYRASQYKLAAYLDHAAAYESRPIIRDVGLVYRRAPVTFTKSHDEYYECYTDDAVSLSIRDTIAQIYYECECNLLSLVEAYVIEGPDSCDYSVMVYGGEDRISGNINDYKNEAATKISKFRDSKGWPQIGVCDLDFFVECGAFTYYGLNNGYLSYIAEKYGKDIKPLEHFSKKEIEDANSVMKRRSDLTVDKIKGGPNTSNLLTLPFIAVLNFPSGAYFDLHHKLNMITVEDICCASVAWAVYKQENGHNHQSRNITLANFICDVYQSSATARDYLAREHYRLLHIPLKVIYQCRESGITLELVDTPEQYGFFQYLPKVLFLRTTCVGDIVRWGVWLGRHIC